MDNQRVLLWAALGFLLLQVWVYWQQDYGPEPVPHVATEPGVQSPAVGIDQSESVGTTTGTTNSVTNDLPAPVAGTESSAAPDTAEVSDRGDQITITTDNLKVTIGTVGGDINSVRLLQYPTSLETPDDPFVLMLSLIHI